MNKKDLEKQNRHILWMLMEFPIVRYLLSNTIHRANGAEKAERHMEMSAIFLASKKLCSIEKAMHDDWMMAIHDATRELTDHMDKTIGFPVFEQPEDYDGLSRKFFDKFLELAEKEYKKITS